MKGYFICGIQKVDIQVGNYNENIFIVIHISFVETGILIKINY